MTIPALTMNNGLTIPWLGFGVFQIPPEETKDATGPALQIVHLERLARETDMVPAVNQIEVHPHFANNVVRVRTGTRHRARGMVTDRPGQGARRSGAEDNR